MKKAGKIAGPVVITIITVLAIAGYFGVILTLPISAFVKVIIGIIPISLITVSVYTLIERIKEIRSGYEDDISKY